MHHVSNPVALDPGSSYSEAPEACWPLYVTSTLNKINDHEEKNEKAEVERV